jgi:protein PsiE
VEQLDKIYSLDKKAKDTSDAIGNLLVDSFHLLALFAIGGTIVWSAVYSFVEMSAKGHAHIHDILLLFIYLELGAMVGIYFKTNHMPTRFLVYVAVTALVRILVVHHEPDIGLVYVCAGILLLAGAALVFRYASSKFPPTQINESRHT